MVYQTGPQLGWQLPGVAGQAPQQKGMGIRLPLWAGTIVRPALAPPSPPFPQAVLILSQFDGAAIRRPIAHPLLIAATAKVASEVVWVMAPRSSDRMNLSRQ